MGRFPEKVPPQYPGLHRLGALYKHIIYRNGIPFSLVLPTAPVARDEMTDAEFNAMMQTGLNAAKTDRSRDASEVFADLRRGL